VDAVIQPKPDLTEVPLVELRSRLRSGEWSAREVTAAYLERIQTIDRGGPALNSVIEINPEALAIAEALDAERVAGHIRGRLHGVPILLKDNIDTGDKMQTTSGSLALAGAPAPRDAFLVRRLRQAGAVILGKTNLSEWANFRGRHSSSGWSSRGGQTHSPYALDRNPCGSSSGSAVAVAASLCAAAVGTETDGSIICPAHANGVVGVKPTVGLISRSGIVPISHSQDTAGPMARCVADAAALLGAMTGVDARDPATRRSRDRALRDYGRGLDAQALDGARLGVARAYFEVDAHTDKVMERALATLAQAGAELIDVKLPAEEKYGTSEVEVLFYEFKADLQRYLSGRTVPSGVRTLQDVIDFNRAHRDQVMPFFQQERMLRSVDKGPLSAAAYRKARATCLRWTRSEGIDAVVRMHRLQAIVAPGGGPAWLTDAVTGDHHDGAGCTSPAAVAGYPSVTVPAGYVFGLPVGLVFFGRAWQEPVLLSLAYAFEQVSRVRRPPQYRPSVDLSRPAWE